MAVCQNQRVIRPFTVGVLEKCREELLKRRYRRCFHLLGLCLLRKNCVVQTQPSLVFLPETGSPPDPREIPKNGASRKASVISRGSGGEPVTGNTGGICDLVASCG